MIRERPILFSAPMVRAILAGTKTQTRRAVKFNAAGRIQRAGKQWHRDDPEAVLACPYGRVGDTLWVRETLKAEGAFMVYAADNGRIDCGDLDWPACIEKRRTIPSIHMPRWASRIDLRITGVRVEKLQEISEDDAMAEGVDAAAALAIPCSEGFRVEFSRLWESINGPGSWDANPFCWVLTFERIKP